MSFFLLTGERGAGKTTFCESLRSYAGNKGLSIAGVLTQTQRNVKLSAVDLSSGEIRPLAQSGSGTRDSNHPLRTLAWIFNQDTLDWGNHRMKEAPRADLFLLDEAGILEFQNAQGWTAGMNRADQQTDGIILVVVRPALIEKALLRWPEAKILTIDPEKREKEEAMLKEILYPSLLKKG